VTKDDYLLRLQRDPWSLAIDSIFPPEDWLAAAWEVPHIRDAHSDEMARTVSKMGELIYTDAYLTALGRSLSIERQVELFRRIRRRSPHREGEFRERFEQFFPRSRSALPSPLSRAEVMRALGLDEAAARVLLDGEREPEA
jgi:hypothetical protein